MQKVHNVSNDSIWKLNDMQEILGMHMLKRNYLSEQPCRRKNYIVLYVPILYKPEDDTGPLT